MRAAAASFVGSIPEHYDAYSGPAIFEPFAIEVAGRLPSRVPGGVLEVACGTGILTRRLRARLGPETRLVASDLSEPMLEYARKRLGEPSGIEWRQADAAALPFPTASFGAVVCQFGIMFVPDKAAAMRETRRVLVDGGLFAFSAWDRLEANPHAQSVTDTIARLFPGDPVADFTRVPYGFNDAARIGELLAASGFVDARFETVRAEVQSPSARSLAIGLVKGTPRALLLQERGASLDAVVDSVAAALVKVGGDGPYRSPAQALVVTARAA